MHSSGNQWWVDKQEKNSGKKNPEMLFCYVSYKYKTMYILKAVHNTRHYTNIQNVKMKKNPPV